jgi:hypothetical protein
MLTDLMQQLKADPNTANAFGAVASAAAAFLALAVSAISLVVSLWSLRVQRRHDVLSVRPLPEVTVADYEDSLRVKIRNNGSGPMIIQSLTVWTGTDSKQSLVECMPKLPAGRPWNGFSHRLENRSLLPGADIVLLELTEYEGEQSFAQCRDLTRAALSALTISVKYSDVYDTVLPEYSKSLDWFGRHTAGR